MVNRLKKHIELYRCIKKWKNKNAHNNTTIEKCFDVTKVTVGKATYGVINPYFYENDEARLIIGSFCSIAEGTKFVFGEHDYERPFTYPIDAYVMNNREINPIKGNIVIEDDVWLGMNSIVLSGVTIHQGAVIGANTVVAKDIPPYAIYAGGRIIKYRFGNEIIDKMLKIDFSKIDYEIIKGNRDLLYNKIENDFWNSDFYKSIL